MKRRDAWKVIYLPTERVYTGHITMIFLSKPSVDDILTALFEGFPAQPGQENERHRSRIREGKYQVDETEVWEP